jgi:Domain of unknown function (DUF4442)
MAVALPPNVEIYFNKLSIKSPLISKLLSMIFLPYISKSGLRMNYDPDNYYAVLPKKRLNTNWYGTIGGAALLANLELAAGSYLFMMTKGEYRMVCKDINYRFLLPSVSDIMYKASTDLIELKEKIAAGGKFNISLNVKVFRVGSIKDAAGKRMGGGMVSFHMWPVRA